MSRSSRVKNSEKNNLSYENSSYGNFPTAIKLGYNKSQVDDFFFRAQSAYDTKSSEISSKNIRSIGFDLEKRGYETSKVDEALLRLESAFISLEKVKERELYSAKEIAAKCRDRALVVANRLQRHKKHKFNRVGFFKVGYHIKDVEKICDMILAHFFQGASLSVDNINNCAFRIQSNGYDERQVDALLDEVIDIMISLYD